MGRMTQVMWLGVAMLAAGCSSDPVELKQEALTPGFSPKPVTKVVVLAKISEEPIRNELENDTVAALKAMGVDAVAAHGNFSAADLAGEDAILARADALGIDAMILYRPDKVRSEIDHNPSVDASVGVPVKVGFFSFFLGSSVPLGGGDSMEKKAYVATMFYRRDTGAQELWKAVFDVDMGQPTASLTDTLSQRTTKKLRDHGAL